ncbi:hypothetical protein BH23GEM10_BH23GEM10_03970 [soil metagenome]
MRRIIVPAVVLLCGIAVVRCDRIMPQSDAAVLPPLATVEATYTQRGVDTELSFSGNVLEVTVQQPRDQLTRGGSLWARVGPYIYLFTPATRRMLDEYPAIAGVRVITMTGDEEVARALLVRDRFNEITWPRAHNVLGPALREGTARPSLIERLAEFGEQHTDYEYNPEFVPPQGQRPAGGR